MSQKLSKLKNWWFLLVILILSWWAVKPLFHTGFFPMHDDQQIARLHGLDKALRAGQIPPRWVDDLGFGFGYPFYNFYPPFVYYLGEVFYTLGFSLITSTKIVILLGFLLSGFFMYLLVKEFFGKLSGILAAIFYIYAPYHALDIYVRGALAEFFSFVFIPAVFLSFYRLAKKPSFNNLFFSTISLSLLLLTHNLIFIAFLPIFFLYLSFLWFKNPKKNKTLFFFFFSILLTLGLTAYFWLPALFEKKFTLVDTILTKELANYKLHFVYLRQFWESAWGYGGSIFGLEDGMSFEIGKLHLIFSLLAGVTGLYQLSKRKQDGFLITFFDQKPIGLWPVFFLFCFSVFMASFHSGFIWSKLKFLWYLQFPWRYLLFSSFFSSFLVGIFFFFLQKWFKDSILKYLSFIAVVLLVIFLNKNYFKPARYLNVTDKDYLGEDIKWRISKTSFEYVPRGVVTYVSDIGTTQVDIKKEEIPKKAYLTKGKIQVKEEKILPHLKKFFVKGEGGVLTINTYHFPGWQVSIDGKKIKVDDNNKFKLMEVKVPEGAHLVEAQFKNTTVRSLGNFLTLITILVLPVLGLSFYEKKKT